MQRLIMTFIMVLVVSTCTLTAQNQSIVTSDYVGIGIDHPAYRLHLFENSSGHMYLNFSNLTTGNLSGDGVLLGIDLNEDFRIHSYEDNDLRFHTNNTFRMILKSDCKLGLNISDPSEGFHLHGNNMLITDNGANEAIRLRANGSGNAGELSLYDTDGTPTLFLKGAENTSEGAEINLKNSDGLDMIEVKGEGFGNAGHMRLFDTDGTQTMILKGAKSTTEGAELLLRNADGKERVELDGEGIEGGGHIRLYGNDSTATISLIADENVWGGSTVILKDASGQATIELDASHGGADGAGRVITDELQIMGGSDLSEYFDIDHCEHTEIIPGMVVSISPDGSGNLRLTTKAYDRTVAGVISGANGVRTGLMMGQESSIAHGDTPVVLAGRAYVWADATFGSIVPGDLLTTSDTPGHVMKVNDYHQAQGTILGKAMTRLEKGKGFVLVLVNLQ